MTERKWGQQTPMPYWAQTHYAVLFGISNVMIGRLLNGLSYPSTQMIQKFEIVLGWPAAEQFPLIPPYWTWPNQGRAGEGGWLAQEDPTDMRYALKLKQVLDEWGDANPRTETLATLRLHPALESKHKSNLGNRYGNGR